MVMYMTTIFDIVNASITYAQQILRRPLTPSLTNASNLALGIFLSQAQGNLGAVRGPPGTGKTSILEELLKNRNFINYLLSNDDLKFIYIAPTNELVTEGFMRSFGIIYNYYRNPNLCDVLSMFRVYGSAIPEPYPHPNVNCARQLSDVVRGRVTQDVKFIFSTDYQSVTSRAGISGYKYLVFVDEASKKPFYLPFTPFTTQLLQAIAQGNQPVIESLFIIGDELQAIGVGADYRFWGKELLALPQVIDVINKLGLNTYLTLQETLRLPNPSEVPISVGFYSTVGANITAVKSSKQALDPLYQVINNNVNRCQQIFSSNSSLNSIINIVNDAVSNYLPVIMVNISQSFPGGETFEETRVELAVLFALAFKCLLKGHDFGILVTAPYRDLVSSARVYYDYVAGKYGLLNIRQPRVRFLTIHSILGGEDDVVITMLGKEYRGGGDIGSPLYTIYFNEPEVFNVQLSRHRRMLIIIGNLGRLRNSAAELAQRAGLRQQQYLVLNAQMIYKTIDELLNLADISINQLEQRQIQSNNPIIGNGGLFIKFKY